MYSGCLEEICSMVPSTMHLVHKRTHFFLDAGHIQTWLLKHVTQKPFTPGSMNTSDDKACPTSCKIGVKPPMLGGKAILFVGEVIDRGRPNEAVAHLYAGEFIRLK
jgi:hypothetical protein